MTQRAVCYVRDPAFLNHTLPRHPESRERLEAVAQLLDAERAWDGLERLPARAASRAELCAAHAPDYVDRLQRLSAAGGGMLTPDTYVTPASFEAASLAAGACAAAARAVLEGADGHGRPVERAIALVRPPGHHAFAGSGGGFCLFNNAAFAVKAALGDVPGHPAAVERVAIVDWDVHHGNGTQDIFYADPRVLYLSTHQSPLYPYTGRVDETGSGAGRGATINVPLPAGTGDAGYACVFDEIVAPAARRFQPQLIVVSAGYDAHWRDPLAGMALSLAGYARLAEAVCALSDELCAGRVAVILEGGYDLDVLSYGVLNTLRALRGEGAAVDPIGPFPGRETPVDQAIHQVKRAHGL